MKKSYIQPISRTIHIEPNAVFAQSIGVGNGPIYGSEDGFEKGSASSRSSWEEYEK